MEARASIHIPARAPFRSGAACHGVDHYSSSVGLSVPIDGVSVAGLETGLNLEKRTGEICIGKDTVANRSFGRGFCIVGSFGEVIEGLAGCFVVLVIFDTSALVLLARCHGAQAEDQMPGP